MILQSKSKAALLAAALSLPLLLAGCNNTQPAKTVESTPITAPMPKTSNPDSAFVTCPPFNPDKTMCTMQYDPVCVKTKSQGKISYKTAGNSCSACGTPEAIGYVQGECS
ncbi:hypothetical protein [Psychrobacter ciconiae]|uniref:hypothetical protein n=1 Tax=Psychrobacter ciconiae TaxID=1553449 RepID=UPI00191805C1|nr:hypothetical protein [Psychrobacter ciconiae]